MKKFEPVRPIYTRTVRKVIDENYRIKTIEVDFDMPEALPGQFLMVWVPNAGERPMSIGNNKPLTISVANVGKVSGELHKLKQGDRISFRGPFGRPFRLPETKNRKSKTIIVLGGGYGVVPIYFLAKTARERGVEPWAIIGARTAMDIILEKQFFSVCKEVFVTTDDGSRGTKGTVMVELERLVETKGLRPDAVFACGPEKMMEAVAKLCAQHKIPCQVSLERYMKCGVGVCGSCAIDGRLCCQDGPVFDGLEVLGFEEFGKVRRDASGRTHGI